MAKEGAREREMHRYYQPWLETFMSTDFEPATLLPPPAGQADGHHPRSSRDKALTAFAQLGCLRLNVKRCVVTLLGTTKQYIIAEATKTLSLLDDAQHGEGDELWFGNSFIEREGGISADAMDPDPYTARDPDGSTFTAPALVVSDIAVHESYKTRGYAGRGVNFYCGVPITTNHGQVIGVYTATDDKPRGSISATELRFLVDMSAIVMQHLETVRNDRTRKRGERLIHGIGRFIEGDVGEESESPTPDASSNETKKNASLDRPKLSRNNKSPEFLGMVIKDANEPSEESKRTSSRPPNRQGEPLRQKSSDPGQGSDLGQQSKSSSNPQKAAERKEKVIRDSQHVFDRAANILRHCLGSDGVIFFNASSANLSSGSRMDNSGSVARVHHSKSKENRLSAKHDGSEAQDLEADKPTNDQSLSSDDSASTRGQSDSSSSQKKGRQKGEILGLAVLDSTKTVSIPEQALRRLVRRHPKGKCFTFDQFGKPASSDESSESMSANDAAKDAHDRTNANRHVFTTSTLLRALPGARTIIFLPLWDIAKQRWHSGLVVWSNDGGSLTNVEDNMICLKAFSNAIMNEVNRIDLALSDTAKSTFLANISHELRSPLHGILGSIEFLHDTAMDDFQSSMVISVETCGKTLLDTVNHVLDYAKIHNLSRAHRHAKGATQGSEYPGRPETSLTEDFDLAIVVEEAVEAVYAGQVFRTANADALEGKSPIQTAASRAMQQRQDRRDNISKGSAQRKSPVRLTLNIDDNVNWRVRSQPGAVRRIVMNILGNALKYTSKGCINVSLEVDRSRSKASSNLHLVLQVSDTGHGMSEDFIKNHAFTAFSQEDSLASGTGLGLSIVRQIVDSLGGKIDLSSEKDLGTDVRIWLSFPKSRNEAGADSDSHILPEMRERTTGLEICMLLPYDEKSTDNSMRSLIPMPTIESSLRNLIDQWFRMKVTTTKTMEGLSPDFFIYPEPPPIDYLMDFHGKPNSDFEIPVIILCTNAFEAASLRSNGVHYLTDIGRVIEVIAQPCGPQKLAKVLHRCMQRLRILKEEKGKKKFSQNVSLTFKKNQSKKDCSPTQDHTSSDQSRDSGDAEDHSHPAPGPTPDSPGRDAKRADLSGSPSENQSRSRRPSSANTGTTDEPVSVDAAAAAEGEAIPPTLESDRPRVLVVDDNQINLHLLVTFVRRSGHPHDSATNGLEAVQTYKKSVQEDGGKRAFKYILMDISMPVMDGMSATKEIRKFEKDQGIKTPAKVIALTGMGSDIAQNEARHAGFDQFLSKPVKFKDLVKLLV
ncbi:sensor histidine kinase/response regulator [Cladophialophora carrionii]|uniref:Sensor histidine kinase/response regulator n=1 Tax=Cladophialophora carrionii TaxID=86049 RepID=A0A1C1CKM0_9EURO|nr:sensor histidine kinase/response regulator [Cladophialophora carrionii]